MVTKIPAAARPGDPLAPVGPVNPVEPIPPFTPVTPVTPVEPVAPTRPDYNKNIIELVTKHFYGLAVKTGSIALQKIFF